MHLLELFEQAVDLLHLNARAISDAFFARGLDDVGAASFPSGHAANDALFALHVALGAAHVHARGFGRHGAGQLVDEAGQAAHLFHLTQLGQEVVEVKAATALDLGGELLRRSHVHVGGDLLDQGNDVAHAQDAAGVTLGIKNLQAVDLLGHTGELDGHTGDVAHRQGRASARVAIGFGQDDAGQRQSVAEGLGRVDRVLTLHGIDHKQRLHRFEHAVELLDFAHQRFVNGQATSGVDQQHVKVVSFGVVERGARDVGGLLVGRAGEPLGPGLGGHGLELLDGRRAVHVARDGEHLLFALLDQVLGQLGGGGGFTRTLQTGHQDDRRRLGREVDVGHALAHGGGEFSVDDAHQDLARREGAHHLFAQGLGLDAGDEVAHHRQGHVGLKQGHAHLAQHLGHVVFGDAGLAAQGFDNAR